MVELPGSRSLSSQVMVAQANFVRVRVKAVDGAPHGTAPPRRELLCVVRTLLKKIKQRVLVGDDVLVTSIDWTDGRGLSWRHDPDIVAVAPHLMGI